MEATCSSLIRGDDHLLANSLSLIRSLAVHEQKVVLFSLLRIISKRSLSEFSSDIKDEKQVEFGGAIGGAAALISNIVQDSIDLKDSLVDWLTGVSDNGIGQDHAIHRAVIAALSEDYGRLIV